MHNSDIAGALSMQTNVHSCQAVQHELFYSTAVPTRWSFLETLQTEAYNPKRNTTTIKYVGVILKCLIREYPRPNETPTK